MALSASWTHCLIAQSVRASEGNSVVVVISGYQIDNDNAVTIKIHSLYNIFHWWHCMGNEWNILNNFCKCHILEKKEFLKIVQDSQEKHLCQSLFFDKVAGFRPFLQNTSGRLFLKIKVIQCYEFWNWACSIHLLQKEKKSI